MQLSCTVLGGVFLGDGHLFPLIHAAEDHKAAHTALPSPQQHLHGFI